MRISEICKILRVKKLSVIRWIKTGKLKAIYVKAEKGVHRNSHWEIKKEDINDYLNKLN